MTLNQVIESARQLQVHMQIENGTLVLDGPALAVDQLLRLARAHKRELIKILSGETRGDVGQCDECGAELLGIIVANGYINRTCPDCGKWFRCFEPRANRQESDGAEEQERVLSKVAADRGAIDGLLSN